AQLRREGRAGKGEPGILVEGLRRSDDRRSRRRDGGGTAEPVCRLWGQAGDILARPQGVRRTEGRISREGTPLATESSRLDRGLSEVRRRKCDRERLRLGLPYGVRRAACGRCC